MARTEWARISASRSPTAPVVVTGTPSLALTLNTPGTVQATYLSDSGTATLTFVRTVATGDSDNDGIGTPSSISSGTMKDAAGNNASPSVSFASTAGVLVDGVVPAVQSIARVTASPAKSAAVDFTVTFSESVTGVDAGDFALATSGVTGASISGVTGSGASYTVTVNTGSGDGTVGLNFSDDDSVVDGAGNPTSGNFTGDVYSIDKTAPEAQSIVRANSDPTAAASVDFTVTFTESVTGVATSDFALTTTGSVSGASITGITGTGATRTVTVNTGNPASGTIRLDVVSGGSIADGAGNILATGFTTGQAYTIASNAPAVVSVVRNDANPNRNASVAYTVTFSESVTGVDASDFAVTMSGVTGATVAGVTGSGATYTVTVNSGAGDGTIRLDVTNDGSIQSSTNLALAAAYTAGEVYTIDKTAPLVQSIVRAGSNPTGAASVNFTVTYSEAVTGVSAVDWALTVSGVSGASVTGFTGSGTTYNVAVSSGSGDGTIRLDVATGGTVIEAAGNPLASGFTSGESYTVDKTAPTVQSIVRANTSPTSAASVNFTVTYSEPVTGVSPADWSLNTTGVTGASVTGFTGSGATYNVAVNTGSGDGTIRLDVVTGGNVIDLAGNPLASGFTAGETYTIQHPPAAPTGLVATAGNAHVALTWTATAGATTYNVKRSLTTGTGFTTIDNVAVASYDDVSAVNGTTYFYKVSAINAAGESADSTEASATPNVPPAAPSVTVVVGDTKVILSWPAVAGATSYNVKRGTVSGTYPTTSNTASTTYTDTAVTNGTTYVYVVTAQTTVEGNPSSEVSAMPNTPAVLGVVISQVYGGGGNSGATLKNDCSANGSADVAINAIPTISVPSTINGGCAPAVVNVPFSLTGTGPWTVQWSDGMTQTGITSSSSSRTITVNASTVLSVTSVTDANCTNGNPGASVTITATNPPAITTQPVSQTVDKNTQATFTVTATGQSLHYQWFMKRPNGTVAAVGTDAPSFSTDPANNTSWFVRVSNTCGTVDSVMVTATVTTRRHP